MDVYAGSGLAFDDRWRLGGFRCLGWLWHLYSAAHDAAASYSHAATAGFETDPWPAVAASNRATSVFFASGKGAAKEVVDFAASGDGFEIILCILGKVHGDCTAGSLGDDGGKG